MKRRAFLHSLAAASAVPTLVAPENAFSAPEPWKLRYILSSALYGEMPLDEILPEVAKSGCKAIDIGFTGYVEIFMHPTPRGVPILPTAAEITLAINRSREYVEKCILDVT